MSARLLFLVLLGLQAVLFLTRPGGSFVGDEPYYAAKARHLVEHGRFAPADAAALKAEHGLAWGTSDWRPQGYPLFVAACSLGNLEPATLGRRVAIVQFLLLAGALWWLFSILCGFVSSAGRQLLIAVLLGATPWPFEFVTLITPDSLTASLFLFATLLLWRKRYFAGSLVASVTFLLRPEVIVLVPIVAGAAVFLEPSRRLRNAIVTALAFLAIVSLQMSYRVWFTGELKPSLFGGLHIQDAGAFRWVHTWPATEKQAYDFVYGLTNGALITTLPDRAFANAAEREAITVTLERVRREGYSSEADEVFARIAEQRRHAAPFQTIVLPRLWRVVHLWVNTETSSQLLNALSHVPRPPRRILLGVLLLAKLTLILLFPIAAWKCCGRDDAGRLALLLTIVVLARTLLIGLVLDWMANRYMLMAWPPLLGVVALYLSRVRMMVPNRSHARV